MTTDETDPKRTKLNLTVPEAMLWAQFASAALTGLDMHYGGRLANTEIAEAAGKQADLMMAELRTRFPNPKETP